MPTVPYVKMNGAGNSILVVDVRDGGTVTGAEARRLGAAEGFRFDQLMAIGPARTAGTAAFVDIFNIDGSRAGACGNGTRCVAFVLDPGMGDHLVVETAGGTLPCHRIGATRFAVDMGRPRFGWRAVPLRDAVADTGATPLARPPEPRFAVCSALSMGNPHAVFFVPDAGVIDLASTGAAIEHDPVFPDRANVSFAEVLGPDRIRLRVWERGAGATLACGSAACATVVAAARDGRAGRNATVAQPGGELIIEWRESDGHVVMTGDVELEHAGRLELGDGMDS